MIILWALLGGLCYRCRGGLADPYIGLALGKGTGYEAPNNIIRSVWALFIMVMLPLSLQTSLLIFFLALLGVLPGYFNAEFDLSLPQNRNWRNYARLTARGMFICLPLAIVMSLLGNHAVWFGVVAGALFVPCYLAGNLLYRVCKIQGHTQYGEWLLGMCIAGVLAHVR